MVRWVLGIVLMLASAGTAAAQVNCAVGSTALMARLLGTTCRSASDGNPATPPAEYLRIVQNIAPKIGIEAKLVVAVIAAELGFDREAVSSKDAKGLMQLMPETAARFGVRDPFNAEENIRGGTTYLHWLLGQFGGNLDLALAAYNSGEGTVSAYGAVPPYDETIQYVGRVKRYYDFYRRVTH